MCQGPLCEGESGGGVRWRTERGNTYGVEKVCLFFLAGVYKKSGQDPEILPYGLLTPAPGLVYLMAAPGALNVCGPSAPHDYAGVASIRFRAGRVLQNLVRTPQAFMPEQS